MKLEKIQIFGTWFIGITVFIAVFIPIWSTVNHPSRLIVPDWVITLCYAYPIAIMLFFLIAFSIIFLHSIREKKQLEARE